MPATTHRPVDHRRPPGKTGPLARYPPVPLLKKWLHPGSMIILDDGYRNDEKIIAEKWAAEQKAALEFHSAGKGSWILHSFSKQIRL